MQRNNVQYAILVSDIYCDRTNLWDEQNDNFAGRERERDAKRIFYGESE